MTEPLFDDRVRAGLRALAEEAGDPPAFAALATRTDRERSSPSSWYLTAAAAAAVVALVVGLVVTASRDPEGDVTTVPPTPSVSGSLPAPATTAPAITAPATTEPAATEPASPATTLVPMTTLAPITTGPVLPTGVDGWPVRTSEPADVADVPAMLPNEPIPGATETIRFQSADDGSIVYTQHVQTMYDPTRPGVLAIRTTLGDTVPPPDAVSTPVDTTGWPIPWESAHLQDGGPYQVLDLLTPDGGVSISAVGFSVDEMIGVARSLQRRPLPEAGWDLIDSTVALTTFAESGTTTGAWRTALWRDDSGTPIAQLTLSTENADAIITAWSPESSVDTVDLDGATAVVAETAGRVAIAWTVADGIEALFGFHGDRATAERIVRGLRAVDETEWLASTTEPDPTDDGCQGMFC